MILVFEMNWSGTVHAPGNAATIQAIAAGCPGQEIRVYAEPDHLRELRLDGIAGHKIALYPQFQGRPGIVAWGRMRHEFALLRAALAAVPRDEPCLLMLLSTTSTGIFAAALAARLRPGTRVQIGLHGDLNELTGGRSRNPLRRAFDLHAAMARPWRQLRFLVLEDAIRDELARLSPAALPRTDVLPLPINAAELRAACPTALQTPIRFGFVGQATEAKGISSFLAIARAMKARYGAAAEFDVIGRADPRQAPPDSADLIVPISAEYLSRAEFTRRLAALHYVVLPLHGDYYRLAASGALLDAVTWLKPMIAGRVPIVEPWFGAGEVGHLCNDAADMTATVDAILSRPDPARYADQVAALRTMRETRSPAATCRRYREIIRGFFPP